MSPPINQNGDDEAAQIAELSGQLNRLIGSLNAIKWLVAMFSAVMLTGVFTLFLRAMDNENQLKIDAQKIIEHSVAIDTLTKGYSELATELKVGDSISLNMQQEISTLEKTIDTSSKEAAINRETILKDMEDLKVRMDYQQRQPSSH